MVERVMTEGDARSGSIGCDLGPEDAQALLRARYPQLAPMQIADLPVIAIRITRATSWGHLVDA